MCGSTSKQLSWACTQFVRKIWRTRPCTSQLHLCLCLCLWHFVCVRSAVYIVPYFVEMHRHCNSTTTTFLHFNNTCWPTASGKRPTKMLKQTVASPPSPLGEECQSYSDLCDSKSSRSQICSFVYACAPFSESRPLRLQDSAPFFRSQSPSSGVCAIHQSSVHQDLHDFGLCTLSHQ